MKLLWGFVGGLLSLSLVPLGCGGDDAANDDASGGVHTTGGRSSGGAAAGGRASGGAGTGGNDDDSGGVASNGGEAGAPMGGGGHAGAFAEGGQGGHGGSGCPTRVHTGDVVAGNDASLAELAGVTDLVGDLTVFDDVTSLSQLACLARIDGSLRVYRTHDLVTLEGLEHLQHVSGNVAIGGEDSVRVGAYPPTITPAPNKRLKSLAGLSGLSRLEGDLSIFYNDALTTTSDLTLATVSGDLAVYENPSLRDVEGFRALTRLHGLAVQGNPVLESFEGFRNVQTVDTNVSIESSSADLKGFRNLESADLLAVSGDGITSLTDLASLAALRNLIVSAAANLHDLRGLERIHALTDLRLTNTSLRTTQGLGPLSELTGTLALNFNKDLTALEGLQGIRALSSLRVDGNAAFVDLSLNSLRSVSGDLIIQNNPVLPNLNGLLSLTRVGQFSLFSNAELSDFDAVKLTEVTRAISIVKNPKLASLSGLRALQVAHDIYVEQNFSLPDLTGLGALLRSGLLTVKGNASLTSLAGLDSLEPVGSTLVVSENPLLTSFGGLHGAENLVVSNNASLTNLAGLENVTELSELTLTSNPKLASLTGLDSLVRLGSLDVESCPSLINLRALSNLSSVSWEGVTFQHNAALPDCEIEWFLNQLPRLDGPITVANNNGAGPCTAVALQTPDTPRPTEMPDVQVQAVVNGTLGCHPFADVYAEPWQTDPTYDSLTPEAASTRLRQRLVGSWVGTATADARTSWVVAVDFASDGTFTSSGLAGGQEVATFGYGGWSACSGKPWTLTDANSLRVFNGALEVPVLEPLCSSSPRPGLLERVREDETLTRLRFSFRASDGLYGTLFDLRRACP